MTVDNEIQDIMQERYSRWHDFWNHLRKNPLALSGLIFLIIFLFISIAGTLLTFGRNPILDPEKVRLVDKLKAPLSYPTYEALSREDLPRLGIYLFGTDKLGRDLFARMLQGTNVSLLVGFVSVGISVLVGIILGAIAGYYGKKNIKLSFILFFISLLASIFTKNNNNQYFFIISCVIAIISGIAWLIDFIFHPQNMPAPFNFLNRGFLSIDSIIMRAVDIMLCFPSFFLILTIIALLPPSIWNIMVVIGLTSWPGITRFVRADFLSLREQDFIVAAESLGIPDTRIMWRHLIPNAMAPVLVSATIGVAMAILTESGLSFLGFGVPPPSASWGSILADGREFIFDAPWIFFISGMAILMTVLAFNLFGEGLRDALNPKLRKA